VRAMEDVKSLIPPTEKEEAGDECATQLRFDDQTKMDQSEVQQLVPENHGQLEKTLEEKQVAAALLSNSEVEAIVGLDGNRQCADCGLDSPSWASVQNSCMLCTECAGAHRGLGVAISFVRSLNLDLWTRDQLEAVKAGSNAFVNGFFQAHGAANAGTDRYLSCQGGLLRAVLVAKRSGEALPTHISDEEKETLGKELARYQTMFQPKEEAMQRPWVPDDQALKCMLCSRSFTVLFRRHHCRACGRCVCRSCAPKLNTKPVPRLGYTTPVLHCVQCFQSAHLAC